MLKGVIFDMDGLMIDTEKLLTRFWCEAANHYGYPMTKEHVLGIRSLAAKYAIPHLKGIFGEDFDYYKVRAKRIELMNEFINYVRDTEDTTAADPGFSEILKNEYVPPEGTPYL